MKPSGYVLILLNRRGQAKDIGCLGRVRFAAGFYVYVGSGGANVVKRIRRHLALHKRRHWHIDYLTAGRNRMKPVGAFVYPRIPECRLAARLAGRLTPIPGFGASDCTCPSHLFFTPDLPVLTRVLARLGHGQARRRVVANRSLHLPEDDQPGAVGVLAVKGQLGDIDARGRRREGESVL
ncbi:GIY-YIG nuclease family protein, partial [candidate division WOR-3 bacterium]|nr:GIY-YIG nuclease family protein [candidate division WOR-3 bacterium]